MGYRRLKRVLDVVVSGMAILVLSPVLLLIALAIKLDSPGPVFFVQDRIGLHRKRFKIFKFRSMRADTPSDVPTHLLRNPHDRITRSGRFLRKTSLDELPQLFNIFRGDMSIVGPRPALWNQYDLEEEREKYGANDILPGLTGWAQINGRDELPIPVKAAFDGEYVRRMSLMFDVKCFLRTFVSVLRSEGVAEGGVKAGTVPGSDACKDSSERAEDGNEERRESSVTNNMDYKASNGKDMGNKENSVEDKGHKENNGEGGIDYKGEKNGT